MVSLQEESENLRRQITDAASAESLVCDSGILLNRACEHVELHVDQGASSEEPAGRTQQAPLPRAARFRGKACGYCIPSSELYKT